MRATDTVDKLDRVVQIFKTSEGHIRPHSIVVGPSGCGKTHNVTRLVEKHDLPYFEINAAQLTKEGLSGNSLSKALQPLLQYGNSPVVVLVDEFDKLFISSNSNSSMAHEVTMGVQNEFLRVLESDTTEVFGEYGKYNKARVKNALFVFMGAFNGQENLTVDDLRGFGVKTEFLGRAGLIFNIEKPSINDLIQLLKQSGLIAQYSKLFPSIKRAKVEADITAELRKNHENNTLGARAINALVHQYYIQGGLKVETVKRSLFSGTLDFNQGAAFKS